MQYIPGNQVWVKCADREWWPAKVQPLPDSFSAFVTNSSEDCCVTFYHDPEQLYPICSSDVTHVRPFHAEEGERTLLEQELFENANVQTAVRRALVDREVVSEISSMHNNNNSDSNQSRHHKASNIKSSSSSSNVKRTLTHEDKAAIIASIKANARCVGDYDEVDTINSLTNNKKVRNRKRKVKEANQEITISHDHESASGNSLNAHRERTNRTSSSAIINNSNSSSDNNNNDSVLPYSVSELRNIQSLLNAVGRDTASQLRASLAEAGVQLTHSMVRRKQVHELAERKRTRAVQNDAIAAFTSQSSSQDSLHSSIQQHYHVNEHEGIANSNNIERYTTSVSTSTQSIETSRVNNNNSSNSSFTTYQQSSVPYLPSRSTDREQLGKLTEPTTTATTAKSFNYCSSEEEEEDEEERHLQQQRQHQLLLHQREQNGHDVLSSYHFTPCVSRSVLNVLRQEVFENAHRFVLSPHYRFRELLGAVSVDNNNVITTLPSPHALWELPSCGFDSHRRVLLVPLTEEYEHTAGWLVPTVIDDHELSMTLFVNGVPIPVPENWHLSAAKAQSAVKTAIALDITSMVLQESEEHSCVAINSCDNSSINICNIKNNNHEQKNGNKRGRFEFNVAHRTDNSLLNDHRSINNNNNNHDLLSLAVGFSHLIPDTELWSGIIACIFVDERSVEEIAQDILCNYRATNTHHTLHLQSASPFTSSFCETSDITNTKKSEDATMENTNSKSTINGKCALDKDAMIDVTEAYVKIQCPLTTLQMRIPVRSVHCEHLQCMELNTVLLRCIQSNLWNCPLCDASMRPNEMVVNYRLLEWIKSHTRELERVNYVIETPPGQPLRIVYQQKQSRNVVSIDVNDEL